MTAQSAVSAQPLTEGLQTEVTNCADPAEFPFKTPGFREK
jgi:hypothetical protein